MCVIYLDNNGTTRVDPRVVDAMLPFFSTHYGNASSSHFFGKCVKAPIDHARQKVAEMVGAAPDDIVFMSNGTETINHALNGAFTLARANSECCHLITQKTEHVAVLATCRHLESMGCHVTYLDVDCQGLVSPEDVQAALTKNTFAVSIMHSNNETGAIQPIAAIAGKLPKSVWFHCDASQSIGKVDVNVDNLGVDLLTIAGHKFYAPKGIGALYVRKSKIRSLPQFLKGGSQEGGQRASTENVAYIVGLGMAAELVRTSLDSTRLQKLRDEFEAKILAAFPNKVRRNGPLDARLPNTASLSFYGLPANSILDNLADRIAASAGAACHAKEITMSYVLEAMQVDPKWAQGTIRFSIGRFNTENEINTAAAYVIECVTKLYT